VIIEFRNPLPCMQHAIYSLSMVDCSDYFLATNFTYLVGVNPGTAYPICRENLIERGRQRPFYLSTRIVCTNYSHTRNVKLNTGVFKSCFHQFVNGVSFYHYWKRSPLPLGLVSLLTNPYSPHIHATGTRSHVTHHSVYLRFFFFQWAFFIILRSRE